MNEDIDNMYGWYNIMLLEEQIETELLTEINNKGDLRDDIDLQNKFYLKNNEYVNISEEGEVLNG